MNKQINKHRYSFAVAQKLNRLTANRRRQFVFAALTAFVFLFAAQTQVAAQNEFKGYKVGRYEGDIVNTTYNVKGTAAFEIRKIDRATGEVTAFLTPTSSNLSGEGTLTGKIDENGVLRVSGPIADVYLVQTRRLL